MCHQNVINRRNPSSNFVILVTPIGPRYKVTAMMVIFIIIYPTGIINSVLYEGCLAVAWATVQVMWNRLKTVLQLR